jgi:hypothetical protein
MPRNIIGFTASDVRCVNLFEGPYLIKDEHFDFDRDSVEIPPHSVIRIVFTK